MARRKTSIYEDFIMLASKLPWWLDILLAIASYFVLHAIASRPAPVVTAPGQMGPAATHGMLTMVAMLGQFLIPMIFGVAALISGINSARQKKLYERIESHHDVAAMNEMGWEDFERLMAEYYRRKGFAVSRYGGNGPDGGVDLVLRKGREKYLVQCKHWKAYKVPVQLVREFYGVMASHGADGGYFVTSGVYTKEALAFATGLNLELVDGHKLRLMIEAARRRITVVTDIRLNEELTEISPTCPVCGGNMKKRIAQRGKHTGEQFWGCANYPKCKGMSAIPSLQIRKAIDSFDHRSVSPDEYSLRVSPTKHAIFLPLTKCERFSLSSRTSLMTVYPADTGKVPGNLESFLISFFITEDTKGITQGGLMGPELFELVEQDPKAHFKGFSQR